MKAEVKSIDLVDFENWDFSPSDPTDFCVDAEAAIGISGEDGSDIFSFQICSFIWQEKMADGRAIFARNTLIISEFNERAIKMAVVSLVEKAKGNSWLEMAKYIGKYLSWEFDDYKSY